MTPQYHEGESFINMLCVLLQTILLKKVNQVWYD
eukprot:UN10329